MNHKLLIAFITIIFTHISNHSNGQVSITGPGCVRSGLLYQYLIKGSFDSSSTMQICVEGGELVKEKTACITTKPVSSIMVQWRDSVPKGKIFLTATTGNASLETTLAPGLKPGAIDVQSRPQQIDSGAIPATIACSPASGGSCAPSYSYQWQRSFDNIKWEDIQGAVNPNLTFSAPLNRTSFFRREVKETASNSVAYSGSAIVLLPH